jgi:hypothetical protein
MVRQKSSKDRSFSSRMQELRLLKKLGSLRQISNLLREPKRPQKKSKRELQRGKTI